MRDRDEKRGRRKGKMLRSVVRSGDRVWIYRVVKEDMVLSVARERKERL